MGDQVFFERLKRGEKPSAPRELHHFGKAPYESHIYGTMEPTEVYCRILMHSPKKGSFKGLSEFLRDLLSLPGH